MERTPGPVGRWMPWRRSHERARSLPGPPEQRSSPGPPTSLSARARARSVSLPGPPSRKSGVPGVRIVSAPPPPDAATTGKTGLASIAGPTVATSNTSSPLPPWKTMWWTGSGSLGRLGVSGQTAAAPAGRHPSPTAVTPAVSVTRYASPVNETAIRCGEASVPENTNSDPKSIAAVLGAADAAAGAAARQAIANPVTALRIPGSLSPSFSPSFSS